MYLIIQSRWIRGSTQSGENIVWAGFRKKEAEGQLKAQTHSHFDMLAHHEYFGMDDVEVDIDTHEIVGADKEGIYYRIKYTMIEVPDNYSSQELKYYLETHKV